MSNQSIFYIYYDINIAAQSAIEEATFGELEAVTAEAGSQIQQILLTAEIAGNDKVAYIVSVWFEARVNSIVVNNTTTSAISFKADFNVEAVMKQVKEEYQKEQDAINTSTVYSGLVLAKENKDIEEYLVETAENTVKSNVDIEGMEVL